MESRPHLTLPWELARKFLNGKKILLRSPELGVHPLVRITEREPVTANDQPTMVIPLPQNVAPLVQKALGMPLTILPLTQDILDALRETEQEGVYALDLPELFGLGSRYLASGRN